MRKCSSLGFLTFLQRDNCDPIPTQNLLPNDVGLTHLHNRNESPFTNTHCIPSLPSNSCTREIERKTKIFMKSVMVYFYMQKGFCKS